MTTHRLFSHLLLIVLCSMFNRSVLNGQIDIPKTLDDRLTISLFASEPKIVTPTGIAVDHRGRVFCIESHTHFRPKDYQGPLKDRIRIYEDTDDDGKADKIINYFEGTTATMNMAFAPDRSLYVATRAKIFRLVDRDEDDQPDSETLIIDLRTQGNYPHNGLSGLAFQDGRLYFGFGENLGVDYELVGTDGIKLSGGGEGGNIYSCRLDGTDLKHMATGFWNPFGLAFDKVGNLFAIDNDPDWRPPCRLLHIVDGGDYGYRFSHGRRGTHPFTAWFGELPGSLGMVCGTGEAPSGILRYDAMRSGSEANSSSSATFLSTSWGLHSIEQFDLKPSGASFVSDARTVIKGNKDFRPVGIAAGPDGTLFISDWCKRSYDLHGHGRIWQVKFRSDKKVETADPILLPKDFPYNSSENPKRQLAANQMPVTNIDFGRAIQAALSPLEKASLIRRSGGKVDPRLLLAFLKNSDPFIRQAARHAIINSVSPEWLASLPLPDSPDVRAGLAIIMRHFADDEAIRNRISEFLADEDPKIRLVALKWIGEEKLSQFTSQLEREVTTRSMTGKLFESYLAAIDMLSQNRKGAEFEKAESKILGEILDNPDTRPDTLVIALRKLQSVSLRDTFGNHPKLKMSLLKKLLQHKNQQVVREAVQTVRDLGSEEAQELLLEIVNNQSDYGDAAHDAVIGLNPAEPASRQALIKLLSRGGTLGILANQTAANAGWTLADRKELMANGLTLNSLIRRNQNRAGQANSAYAKILGRLDQADANRGRLIFYNNRFGQCAKCHQVDGRGSIIGPDLSNLSNMSHERLLESILYPSKEMAPRHTPWLIETYDGNSFTGVLVAERSDVQTYADSTGKLFKVRFDEIERKKPVEKSIMPEALLDLMTDQEVADLIRFLKKANP